MVEPDEIEDRIRVTEPDSEYNRQDSSTVGSRVAVVVLPDTHMVEVEFSPQGETDYTHQLYYSPTEAMEIGRSMGTEPVKFPYDLTDDHFDVLVGALDAAGTLAGEKEIGDIVGEGALEGLKEGKITTREFIEEFGRQVGEYDDPDPRD